MANISADRDEYLKLLLAKVRRFPLKPGVYLMRNSENEIIYIGKAKILRERVKNYFQGQDTRANVPYILNHVAEIDYIVAGDERQAIIIEADLIKKHQPRYNIRLKDDRSPFLVRVDYAQNYPRLELVRERFNKGGADTGTYYGPYTFSYEIKALVDIIRMNIPLRTCSDRVMNNRVRPCLEYQIKRCLGPCCLLVDQKRYRALLDSAIAVLQGRNLEVIEKLESEIEKASGELRFEDAAEIRDRWKILKRLEEDRTSCFYSRVQGSDVFGIYREATDVEVAVMMVREGRIKGVERFTINDVELPDEEVLSSVVYQYYSGGHEIPQEVIIPRELPESELFVDFLRQQQGSKVEVTVPERGAKSRLLELAHNNARDQFAVQFGKEGQSDEGARVLQEELGLSQLPRVIECVDVSHFQGRGTVSSVVCFQDGKPWKEKYRLFHLSIEGKVDDFASIHEVVTRHLRNCAEEGRMCDLMVIDGGREQLAQAIKARTELGLNDPPMIGLAKRRCIRIPSNFEWRERVPFKPERIYVEDSETLIVLQRGSAGLNILEQLRDEAHRFAITFHRKTRAKKIFKSPLDDIIGIGSKRKVALLKEFGGTQNIAKLSPEELVAKVPMSLKLAELVIGRLRDGQKTIGGQK